MAKLYRSIAFHSCLFVCLFVFVDSSIQMIKEPISAFAALPLLTLAGTDLLCMLNWGTQWTMVSYLKK